MPDPIAVIVLGRLAIDRTKQGQGLDHALLRDADLRLVQAAGIIGVGGGVGGGGVLVDAISDDAKAFYRALGMVVSPLNVMKLMITLTDLRASLSVAPCGTTAPPSHA